MFDLQNIHGGIFVWECTLHKYPVLECTLRKYPVLAQILNITEHLLHRIFAAWKYLFVTWNIRNALI